MQILCKKDTLNILISTYGDWHTPGEFTNPIFACIECACDPDFRPVAVTALGQPEPITVAGQTGRIYRNATVQFEPVPQPERK